jgi:hypothetical protein
MRADSSLHNKQSHTYSKSFLTSELPMRVKIHFQVHAKGGLDSDRILLEVTVDSDRILMLQSILKKLIFVMKGNIYEIFWP